MQAVDMGNGKMFTSILTEDGGREFELSFNGSFVGFAYSEDSARERLNELAYDAERTTVPAELDLEAGFTEEAAEVSSNAVEFDPMLSLRVGLKVGAAIERVLAPLGVSRDAYFAAIIAAGEAIDGLIPDTYRYDTKRKVAYVGDTNDFARGYRECLETLKMRVDGRIDKKKLLADSKAS